jgi:hypothetical protein
MFRVCTIRRGAQPRAAATSCHTPGLRPASAPPLAPPQPEQAEGPCQPRHRHAERAVCCVTAIGFVDGPSNSEPVGVSRARSGRQAGLGQQGEHLAHAAHICEAAPAPSRIPAHQVWWTLSLRGLALYERVL